MKKIKYLVLFIASCLLACLAVILIVGKRQEKAYSDTYYAALVPMYQKLNETEGKKIVVIGNSSVVFGVDSELAGELLKTSGHEYTVCNFGLYGTIGTRVMLNLAEDCINEGDIVIFMPEASSQPQSLYFSSKELWYALESDTQLLWKLDKDIRTEMLAAYPCYISGKRELTEKPSGSEIYARSSFDSNMDLKNYDREFNIMSGGTDENNRALLDKVTPEEAYFTYVNSFYTAVKAKGAEMYFMYGPVNEKALVGDLTAYCERIESGYAFPVMGDIENSVMEPELFYDSNFHLNSTGMEVFTVLLVNNIKTRLSDTSVTEYSLPNKPDPDRTEVVYEGNDKDNIYFLYEETEGGYKIVGLTEEGKSRGELIVPASYLGKAVTAIDVDTFEGANSLRTLIVQPNIKTLPDYMLKKCKGLTELRLEHSSPQEVSVGYHLLAGTSAKISVSESAKSSFKNNYFWGYYAEVIVGYE